MTLIVGIEHKGHAIMACDSLVSGTYGVDMLAASKLVRLGEYVIGYCGEALIGDVVSHLLDMPPLPASPRRAYGHLVTAVMPLLRAAFKEHKVDKTEHGDNFGGRLLIAARGLVFEVCCDYQVSRSQHGYIVVGSGATVALGSLASSERLAPRARAVAALLAAERHTSGVRRPWRFMTA